MEALAAGSSPPPARAAAAWSALDARILRDLAPLVPMYYDRCLTLSGRRVGDVYLHSVLGLPALERAFVR